MIPHKVLNIRCYICTCLALFFIFVFIRLLEYQILQFHAFIIFSLHINTIFSASSPSRRNSESDEWTSIIKIPHSLLHYFQYVD